MNSFKNSSANSVLREEIELKKPREDEDMARGQVPVRIQWRIPRRSAEDTIFGRKPLLSLVAFSGKARSFSESPFARYGFSISDFKEIARFLTVFQSSLSGDIRIFLEKREKRFAFFSSQRVFSLFR